MKRLLAILAMLALVLVATPTAFAEDYTETVAVNESYLGQTLLGTAVAKYSGSLTNPPVSMHVTWSFSGQINAKYNVSASGAWDGVWDGKAYRGNITSIDSWDGWCVDSAIVGGVEVYGPRTCVGKPATPKQLDVTAGSVWVTVGLGKLGQMSFPVRLQGGSYDSAKDKALPAPFQGNRSFAATNVAGVKEVSGLPRTGEAPEMFNFNYLAIFGIVAGGAFLLAARRLRRRAA